jgi:hypothetical protein
MALAAQELAQNQVETDESGFLPLVEEVFYKPEVMRDAELDIRYVQTGHLNIFSQQRSGRNEQHEALKNSLREGQINPINIMIADRELVLEYLAFTNKTWRSNITEDQLRQLSPRFEGDPDAGKYVILIAGHSRVHALRELALDEMRDPDTAELFARVHHVDDVRDILRIQLAENIHSSPHRDRSFRAIAEMYMFMQEKDKQHRVPKGAFARYFGISEGSLRDALNYVALPDEVRSMTDDGVLPMGVLIELARARQAIVDAHTITAANDPKYAVAERMDDEEAALMRKLQEEAVNTMSVETIRGLIAHYNNLDKRSVAAGRALFRTHAEALRRRYAPQKIGNIVVEMDALFEDAISVADQIAADRAVLKRHIEDFFARDASEGRELAKRLSRLGQLGLEAAYLGDVQVGIQSAVESAKVIQPA